jgi:two-component system sensor histidine kinase KdpD
MEARDPDDTKAQAHRETLTIVSHDIRAPLGVILGAVTELASPSLGALTEEQRALLQLVRRSCEKLTRLANNVAFLQRIEGPAEGKLDLATQRVDLRVLVRRALEGFAKAGEVGKLSVVTELPEAPAEVTVDPERASLALVNVLANAVRFARREVRVAIVTHEADVTVVVEDDGPGIAPTSMAGLFDRQARIRASAGKTASGLGLVIAKAIVDAHGGTIRGVNRADGDAPAAEATPVRGARFEIGFPRAT